MTLRARLFAGLLVVLVTLGLGGAAVMLRQRAFLIGQLDDRLRAASGDAQRTVNRVTVQGAAYAGAAALSDAYIGVQDPTGELVTLLAPTGDPMLVPALPDVRRFGQPFTAPTLRGATGHVRVIEVPLRRRGRTAVFAVSTSEADAAFRQLLVGGGMAVVAVCLVLALVAVWILRLGLRPIQRMTEAADAIASGDTDRRVESFPEGTEAARLGHALNLLVDTAQESERRLRRFVADASHELRTPLTTLRGYTALHQAGGLPEPAQVDDAMRRIGSEATRMSLLVDDLLLLAAIDEGRPLERAEVDLVAIITGLVDDMRVIQPARPVRLMLPNRAIVVGDAGRLTQVFAALTSNAMRHTPETAAVDIALHVLDRVVRVEVSDDGHGIPAEERPRVFERFYRADRARSRAVGGSGLGLAIVSAIVTAHRGRVGVDGGAPRGATFWVELPTTT